jgi:hypothetical protein
MSYATEKRETLFGWCGRRRKTKHWDNFCELSDEERDTDLWGVSFPKKEPKMSCKICDQWDGYQSQGGQSWWFQWGYCHKHEKTFHQSDSCETNPAERRTRWNVLSTKLESLEALERL